MTECTPPTQNFKFNETSAPDAYDCTDEYGDFVDDTMKQMSYLTYYQAAARAGPGTPRPWCDAPNTTCPGNARPDQVEDGGPSPSPCGGLSLDVMPHIRLILTRAQ